MASSTTRTLAHSKTDHLTRHLCYVPAHRAIVRALEARLYEGIEFKHPVLDIGCGDGYFALAALPLPIDVGIDPSPKALAECAQLGIYGELKPASGAKLPFPDAAFATVVSNCVLEHIPEIDKTLAEISRVLKPGGMFIGTMVTDQLAGMLGIPRLLRPLGLKSLGESYARWFNRNAVHYNMLSVEEWTRKLEEVGLHVTRARYYMDADTTRVFDFLHYYAIPSAIVHKLFRRWLLVQHPANVALISTLLRGLYENDKDTLGACVFVIAVK